MRWLDLLRPGDWLLAGLGLAVCAASFPLAWQAGRPEKAVVRRGGEAQFVLIRPNPAR